MSEVPGSRGFAHRPRVHSAGDERGPWISGFRSSLGGFQSEAGRAFVAEGGDALAVLGGAHRLVEEADRIAHRRRRVVAEEILGELALGDGDLATVGERLVVAFAAVILALITASIAYAILTIRRRWLLQELKTIEERHA